MNVFEKIVTETDQPHWFKDLLHLWRPSGRQSEEFGLRLAIRNGKLNFYRRGQSIGQIVLNRQGQPKLSVHAKYVLPEEERRLVDGREYATLIHASVVRPKGLPAIAYHGLASLKGWIKTVDKYYSEKEKQFIDELLGVRENDGIIDLEMGLPAWGAKKTSVRMDLVSIDRVGKDLTVSFGEVKRVKDSRLRCEAPLVIDEMPEVLKQLRDYREYLGEQKHRGLVGSQYTAAARLLRRFREMANIVGPVMPLGPTILEAADYDTLAVARLARLIVFDDHQGKNAQWEKHWEKLKAEKERVPLMIVETATSLNFGTVI